jgi:hypothetical protein
MSDVLPLSDSNMPLRFTPHLLLSRQEGTPVPLGQDYRYPQEFADDWTKDWPLPYLWDYIYGVVIANKYGVKDTMAKLKELAAEKYYPDGMEAYTEKMKAELKWAKEMQEQREEEEEKARDERGERRSIDIYDLVLNLWTYHEEGPLGKKAKAEYDAKMDELEQARQREIGDKVSTWRHDIEEASSSGKPSS